MSLVKRASGENGEPQWRRKKSIEVAASVGELSARVVPQMETSELRMQDSREAVNAIESILSIADKSVRKSTERMPSIGVAAEEQSQLRACYELFAGEGVMTSMMTRQPYPSDVSDDEWTFVAPYLTLMKADAPQRQHDQ